MENLNKLITQYKKSNISLKGFESSDRGLFDQSTAWVRSDYLDNFDNWLKVKS